MQGGWFRIGLLLIPLLAAGCDEPSPLARDVPAALIVAASSEFDPATAGSIQGQVLWNGELPDVPDFKDRIYPFDGKGGTKIVRENPNAPAIDPTTDGVTNAVVYLRGVDAKRARPWDHPAVRIEQRDFRLQVSQGETDSRVGFVRRGEEVEMVSRQTDFHSLRARGAAFFTLAFPEPNQPLSRRLGEKGVVEFSSGTSYYWMRCYLLVDDHPYSARTDGEGRFTLGQVPPGNYEVVCWMPNWHKERHERHTDTALYSAWHFHAPMASKQPIALQANESRQVEFTISVKDFAKEPASR